MEILKVDNLSFTYPQCTSPTLSKVSFSIQSGEFVVICGGTGSGKTTLLRMLKRELSPLGEREGNIYISGTLQEKLSERDAACSIGYVMQKPEQQLVTDKVWHELAFGLENMNVPQQVIARRIAEVATYFGIEEWFEQSVSKLSGGQKQLLNLAAVMVMQPSILILDEPTAQLDPIAASNFIHTLKKLNQELGMTIVIVEHWLEEVIPVCDKMLVLEKGSLVAEDIPQKVLGELDDTSRVLHGMPAAARLFHMVHGEGNCPLDVGEGRRFIGETFRNRIARAEQMEYVHSSEIALQLKDVYFRYEKTAPDVLKGVNLTVYENEIFCILGGNGSGKTTMLNASGDLLKIYSGCIKVFGKKLKDYKNQSLYKECLTLLPQDVQTVFLRNTVREELEDAGAEVERLPYDIDYMYNKHPYDLSGGEQQLVALAKVLATKPRLLLLDEPTKGIDAYAKKALIQIIKQLQREGMTIVIVTHDVEFAAECSDRCAMFFHGNVVAEGIPQEFFGENCFYTTAASRMTKGYYEGAITVEEVGKLCLLNGKKDGDSQC